MMKQQLVRRAARLLDRRTLRFFAILGTVLAVCSAIVSALGAVLLVRQLQLVALQRKTLPILRDAAQLYLEKNGVEKATPSRKKRLLFPRAKATEQEDLSPEETE